MTNSAEPDHRHTASNGRAELTLEDLAVLHGGFSTFMVDISNRSTRLYLAGMARNRRVAAHQLGELTKVLRLSVRVRPEYQEAIEKFIDEDLVKVRTVISTEEWERFEEVWKALTIAVNQYHDEFNHGYLVWKVPADATSDLDLTALG